MNLSFLPFVPGPPVVSVLRLAGVISPGMHPLRGSLSLSALAGLIERACTVRGVRALALQVNSPGGSPVQSALIANRIRALTKEHDLPVFAFVEDVAASGGYWLACAANEIYADRASVLGSIGVVSAGFGFVEALDKLGIERRLHAQGRRKGMLDPFRAEDPEDVRRLETIQVSVHQAFKDHVRERRGKRLKGDDESLFNGDIWTGEEALALGLIDGLGDLRSVMRDRFGERVRLRVVAPPRGWLRRRFGMHAPQPAWPDAGELALGLIAALEQRALWSRFGL
jgi:signal peptide peptidase SppA